MIQLQITKTGKGYSLKDKYRVFDNETLSFPDMKSAKDYITETYGKSKRSSMYVDTKEGKTKKIGYVIGFRNADMSHYPVNKWLQQDWIEFNEINNIDLERVSL